MSERSGPERGARTSLTTSIVAGMILVPLSAVAAVLIVTPRQVEDPVLSPPAATALPTSTTIAQPTLEADLREACGPAGESLVQSERTRSISDTQQAALDALRPVCAAVGMPLGEQPLDVPDPAPATVETETDPPQPQVSVEFDHDDDESEWEGEWEWESD